MSDRQSPPTRARNAAESVAALVSEYTGRDPTKRAVLGTLAGVVALLALFPMLFLLWTSVWSGYPGQFDASITFENFDAVYLQDAFDIPDLLANSLLVAGGITVISVSLGLTFAWLFVRTNLPTKSAMELAILSPYAVPGYIYAIMYIDAFGPDHGLVTTFMRDTFGVGPPIDIFSPLGITIVAGVDAVTSIYLLTAPALQQMDPALEEAGRIHGANVLQTIRSVSFPVIAPAILTALIIRFLLGLGEFSIVAILGARRGFEVYATAIWAAVAQRAPPEYGQAAALSLSLLLITGMLVWYYRRTTRRKEDYMTVTGRGYRPDTWDLGRWRWPIAGVLWTFIFAVWILPVLVMVVVSLHSTWLGEVSLRLITLENYVEALTSPRVGLVAALADSLVLSVSSATLGTVLVVGTAYYTERTEGRLRGVVDFLSMSLVAVPGIILGTSILFTFLWLGKLSPFLDLYGTIWLMVIGCVVAYIPISSRIAVGSIVQIHSDLEESARVLGASWTQQMREIFLPLFRNTAAAIWFYLVIHVFQLITIPLITYSPGTEVISVRLFNIYMNQADLELVSAISTLFIGLMFLILLGLRGLGVTFYEITVRR